jgi:FkbM family methyltransferase
MVDQNEIYDMQAFIIMQRCLESNSNCIDVGAHSGKFLDEMLKLSPKGNHFAFEPLPELNQQLIDQYASSPNVKIFNIALSNTVGESTFQHVCSNPGYSGLRKRRYDRPNETINEIIVNTNMLDNIIPKDLPIHFVKIDVEGAELGVLQGGRETIQRCTPFIVFEHGLGAADYYNTSPTDLYDLISSDFRMKIFVMEDWLNRKHSLSRQEFNDQFYRGTNYFFMAHP